MAGIMLLAACGGDGLTAPPDATSSCEIEVIEPDGSVGSHTTLWYDEMRRVVRVDAYDDDHLDFFMMEFDPSGRLASLRYRTSTAGMADPDRVLTYSYEPERISVTGLGDFVYDLVDGRLTHFEGPLSRPPESRSSRDYAYDASGRITSFVSLEPFGLGANQSYTYDVQGRVASKIERPGDFVRTISYSEVGARTEVRMSDFGNVATYDVDANGRITLSAHDLSNSGPVDIYTYDEASSTISVEENGFRARAVGDCDPPTVRTAPRLPLPLSWEDLPVLALRVPFLLPNRGASLVQSMIGG